MQVSLPKLFFFALFTCLSWATQAQNEIQTATQYLTENATKHKLLKQDIDRMTVSSAYLSPTTGWYHIYFNQTFESVEVYNSLLSLVVKDGQVQHTTGSFVPNIEALVNQAPISVSPIQALQKAALEANLPINTPIQIREISNTPLADGTPGKIVYQSASISDENIVVKKYWFPYEVLEDGKPHVKVALTWNVQFLTKDQQNGWSMHIDAHTGETIRKVDEVIHCSFGMVHRSGAPHDCSLEHGSSVGTNAVLTPKATLAPDNTYNVFDYPLEAPTFGSRSLVASPYDKFVPLGTGPGATNGWHFDGTTNYTTTRGNNVWAQEDANNNNGTGYSPTSSTLDFNYPYTQGLSTAAANRDAAITNLFYWNNLIHDVLWKYGFDEPSGNFQNTNQGRGGNGNDYVFADAQDGGGTNNANFFTPIDGLNGRMQMYLWTNSGSYQPDGDFDNGIITHEYGHGWSTRLTGGPNNSACLQNAEQGGEGWSDYLTLMLTTDWSSLTATEASGNIPRGIGTYALKQATNGAGIRPYRYAYFNQNTNTVNSAVTYAGVGNTATFSLPHGIGSIWATMLWDMTWEIILQDAQIVNNIYSTPSNVMDMKGNIAALKLVNEGLRLQPCSPSFVQARDAILAADGLLFGGRYRCAIGRAFARRGLGALASTGVSTNDRIVTEDFTPISGASLNSPVAHTVCSNQPFNYTATTPTSGTTFSWTRDAVSGISNTAGSGNSAAVSETLVNTSPLPVTVKYRFTLNPATCPGNVITQDVNVIVTPTVAATVPAYSVCQNTAVPSGEGLVSPAVLVNSVSGLLSITDTYVRAMNDNSTVYVATPGSQSHYKTITFVAPNTEAVTFEVTYAGVYDSDTYLSLYESSFNPAAPATNFLRGDDDIDYNGGNYRSQFTHNLVAGTTYILVVASYYNLDPGPFILQSTPAVFSTGPTQWYLNASGGAPLATGNVFNPVGVSGSGIANTASAGVTTFYAASPLLSECRTPVTFTITPTHSITLTSVASTETQTVCTNTAITPITYSLGGGATNATVTGLPDGVTYSVNAGVLTISGSPTTVVGSPFNYNITTTGNTCTVATESGTIAVNTTHSITLTSVASTETQTVCTNTAITSITYSLGGGATNATVTGLPSGVTYSVNAGVLTISGSPTTAAGSPFNYNITTSGSSCTAATESGTITVNLAHSITLTSVASTKTQAVCINTAITPITYSLGGGATNATVTGLPSGVTYSVNAGVLTISGPPNTAVGSPFNYNITTTGNTCTVATESGTITIGNAQTITLTSPSATEAQTLCVNTAITSIVYTLGGGATNATVTGLPNGVTYSVSAGVLTISGSPTTATGSPFGYTITTTGSVCTPTTKTGTLTVNAAHGIVLTSSPTTETQIACINSAIVPITYVLSGGATGATVTGLPTGVTSAINGGVLTISGAPTTISGNPFSYSIITTGNACATASESGTITVQTKPVLTLSVLQQTLNEGNSQVICDIDANPVNSLQFNVSGTCGSGSPVWRVQVGSGAWSAWSATVPVSQSSNNQPHRYQAACDANCPTTYTGAIELQINYRSSVPQAVSMVADGVTVAAGETKDVCNVEGNELTFNATCAAGEVLIYSVDGSEYGTTVPTQLVDGQYHNYRVRCRKSDGTSSCVETESGVMRLRLIMNSMTPVVSLNVTSGCGNSVAFTGTTNCGVMTSIWYNATTNTALPSLPSQTPSETTSYYVRCQAEGGCLSGKSNVVTYTVSPVNTPPVVIVSSDVACTGTEVTISTNCPAGTSALWNTGITEASFKVAFANITKQSYSVRCVSSNGCQSGASATKDVYWKAYVVTLINIGESKSSVKTNDRAAWVNQFITRDGGPELEQSTQQNPTLFFTENVNKIAPRYWTINVDACALGTDGSLTFDMLATPETGLPRSFNTHENNAPYFMYANREGWTELYAQNHPAYGFYENNGAGGNVYDAGLPKGLYKLGVRYWDQKGWGSIYPSTRKPQGNVLAYQEYWFRIQSKDGVGVGAARMAESSGQEANGKGQGSDNEKQLTDNGAFASVMPNPVTQMLRLQIQNSKGQVVQTMLLDAAGRQVLGRRFEPETNTHQEEFGVSELPTGMYFMKVTTSEKSVLLKVVKL
ncbi:T9SS C-terminal target domain-containing protein [Runella sp. SP2]|nr:T9SS C-terminal target domain-containing protein [Runella sp. SP2]